MLEKPKIVQKYIKGTNRVVMESKKIEVPAIKITMVY